MTGDRRRGTGDRFDGLEPGDRGPETEEWGRTWSYVPRGPDADGVAQRADRGTEHRGPGTGDVRRRGFRWQGCSRQDTGLFFREQRGVADAGPDVVVGHVRICLPDSVAGFAGGQQVQYDVHQYAGSL